MRSRKDRRKSANTRPYTVADFEQWGALSERRKHGERRLENLAMEERQTLLSEMPWPSSEFNPDDKSD
jgi:hypothetical protein